MGDSGSSGCEADDLGRGCDRRELQRRTGDYFDGHRMHGSGKPPSFSGDAECRHASCRRRSQYLPVLTGIPGELCQEVHQGGRTVDRRLLRHHAESYRAMKSATRAVDAQKVNHAHHTRTPIVPETPPPPMEERSRLGRLVSMTASLSRWSRLCLRKASTVPRNSKVRPSRRAGHGRD